MTGGPSNAEIDALDAAIAALDTYLETPPAAPKEILAAWHVVRGAARRNRRASMSSSSTMAAMVNVAQHLVSIRDMAKKGLVALGVHDDESPEP